MVHKCKYCKEIVPCREQKYFTDVNFIKDRNKYLNKLK